MATQSHFHAYPAFQGMGALIFVKETIPGEYWGDPTEVITHGPFMDLADAFDQCGEPANWRADKGCPE